MKKTQPDATDLEQTADLTPTAPDAGGGEATERERRTSSRTRQVSFRRYQIRSIPAHRDVSPSQTAGRTVSLDDLGFEEATQPPKAGAATLDAPPSGDRGNTLSFSLHSDADDTERTLPPGAEQPERIRPKVAGYEILGVLGEGGMGIVFKAKQDRLGRFVALKMIRAGAGARSQDLARFEAEAQAVAAIEHPNIVRIFEIGEHGGMPFCSLEYLSGGSLAKQIGGKPQPPAEAARIVSALAAGMVKRRTSAESSTATSSRPTC